MACGSYNTELMENMTGWIILRDIPKDQVQLDLVVFEVQGGFRGFALVPPGLHYVALKENGQLGAGFWCLVAPGTVVVRVYDYERREFERDSEQESTYQAMARSGAMNRALIPAVRMAGPILGLWQKLTAAVGNDGEIPVLHAENPMVPPLDADPEFVEQWYTTKFKSRFMQAFEGTHKGNVSTLLAELQYAFVRSLVREGEIDEGGQARWQHLFLAITQAGEHTIRQYPEVFARLAQVVQDEVEVLKDMGISMDDGFTQAIEYFVEDLEDAENEILAQRASAIRPLITA